MSAKLNDMIVCPVCKGRLLQGDGERRELVCPRCRLAFEARHYSERSAALDPK